VPETLGKMGVQMGVRLGQCDRVLFSLYSVEIVHAKCVVAADLWWRP
jgi:hypothetical protein